ncbi:MAG TPA: site-specific integrase [Limosilactobacillus coleohominis]|nr:site-specific integrase [Limosilactobacillus coleohominis]
MTIRLVTNKNSKHCGQYWIRPQTSVHGKMISAPVHYAETKSKARKIEADLIDQIKTGHDFNTGSKYLPQALSEWINKQIKMERWSPASIKTWRYTEKMVHCYLGGVKVRTCDEDTVREFITTYAREHHASITTHSTASKLLQQLRTFFLTLEGDVIIKSPVPKRPIDYFFRRDKQSITKEKYAMTDQEFQAFRQAIKDDLTQIPIQRWVVRMALWVEAETGMRPQEIQALKLANLAQDEGHWVFRINDSYSELTKGLNGHLKARRKGESRLTPPITQQLYDQLQIFKQKQEAFIKDKGLQTTSDLLFLNLTDYRLARLGYPVTQRSMNDMLKELCRRIGVNNGDLPLSCYTLRTTCGTRLARLGDYSYACNRLGNSLAVYMRYYVKTFNTGYSGLMDRYLSM